MLTDKERTLLNYYFAMNPLQPDKSVERANAFRSKTDDEIRAILFPFQTQILTKLNTQKDSIISLIDNLEAVKIVPNS